MKLFKGYKAVALVYLVITILNIIWVVSYNKPSDSIKQVSKEKNIVLNS